MSNPFIGQIQAFGFDFAPSGWAICNGSLQSIPQNPALFSLLGTIYGGDGSSTFGLPDLRGRAMVQNGTGASLDAHPIGQNYGAETTTIGVANLPAHTHNIRVQNDAANLEEPAGAFHGATSESTYATADDGVSLLNGGAVTETGGGGAIPINGPRLAVTICIALQGIYPSSN